MNTCALVQYSTGIKFAILWKRGLQSSVFKKERRKVLEEECTGKIKINIISIKISVQI
jgi:hypothetical protein